MTNFLGALVQCDAAMEIFRAQERGHLVMVSSMSAMRGLPKTMTTYAATKAGVAHLAEGLRNELYGTELGQRIKVTVLYPGYIASEMNEHVRDRTPMMVSTEKGVKAMVVAIEKEKADACVPPLPWAGAGPGHEARAAAGVQAPALRPAVGVGDLEVHPGQHVAEAAVLAGAPGEADGEDGVRRQQPDRQARVERCEQEDRAHTRWRA